MKNAGTNKKLILFLFIFLSFSLVSAQEHDFNETKQLVDSGINCDELTDEQLEAIGEYYMEQMHPGEAHDLMHKMMGLKEGTKAEEQFHINMAKMLYCNEDVGGMMSSGGMIGGNMMGSGGMMSMMGGGTTGSNMMGSGGMMGNYGGGFGYWNFINILYIILLIGAVILIILLIIKLWKSIENKKGGK